MADDQKDRKDLAAQVTERVDAFVTSLKAHSVRPVASGARIAVATTAVLFVVVFVLVALGIGLVRLFTNDVFGHRVWASDFLFGGILVALGAFIIGRGRMRT